VVRPAVAAAALAALAACGSTRSAGPNAAASPAFTAAEPTPAATPGSAPPPRVGPAPLTPVAKGHRPPQVVVVAFDGAGAVADGSYLLSRFWGDVGRSAGARFTFFLSGPYLLTHRHIGLYDAPQLGPATQAMPFEVSGVLGLRGRSQAQALRYEMEQLRDRHAEGHEIGTHFNGHLCGNAPGSVARFSAADWRQEVAEFDDMVDRANENNGVSPAVDLGFTSRDIVGSRTPCLEGDLRALYPVLERHGYTYDTSPVGYATDWPKRGAPGTGRTRLWVFPLSSIELYGGGSSMLSMDYNICYAHQACHMHAAYPARTTARWSQQTLDSYRAYFQANYTGDRAPVFLGQHGEMWHDGAYTKALAAFVTETCGKPEVKCVTYAELARWLDATPAAQLGKWRKGRFPHYSDPAPPAYGHPVPGAPAPQRAD
jgi:hypothetical protein